MHVPESLTWLHDWKMRSRDTSKRGGKKESKDCLLQQQDEHRKKELYYISVQLTCHSQRWCSNSKKSRCILMQPLSETSPEWLAGLITTPVSLVTFSYPHRRLSTQRQETLALILSWPRWCKEPFFSQTLSSSLHARLWSLLSSTSRAQWSSLSFLSCLDDSEVSLPNI